MRLNHENLARYDLLFTCNRNFCKEFSGNIVVDLINEKCTILMSEITLFEILAKGAKYVASSLLRAKRVIKEWFRENLFSLPPKDFLVFIRRKLGISRREIGQKIRAELETLVRDKKTIGKHIGNPN